MKRLRSVSRRFFGSTFPPEAALPFLLLQG